MKKEQLKEARGILGLSQEGLARKIGVSTSAVQKWEQGLRPVSGIAEIVIRGLVKDNISETVDIFVDTLVKEAKR